jgi:hypothetical protein
LHPLIVTWAQSLEGEMIWSPSPTSYFTFFGVFLPWQGLEKREAILESKRTITAHNLSLGLPVEFRTFFEHCRSLSFDEKPNYDNFYDLFGDLVLQEGFQLDMAFEWDIADGKTGQDGTDKDGGPLA